MTPHRPPPPIVEHLRRFLSDQSQDVLAMDRETAGTLDDYLFRLENANPLEWRDRALKAEAALAGTPDGTEGEVSKPAVWGSWAKGEWDAEEPCCVRCFRVIDLRDGCEWSDFSELNLCPDCAIHVLESLRPEDAAA